MLEKTICAGFGGQGVMSMGRLIAETAMANGFEVSWLPSYGPEMRGGTANCHVIVSSTPIGSPVISADATSVLALNLPSMHKFATELVEQGLMIFNSSLIEQEPDRRDIRTIPIAANEIASDIGNLKAANMVMLGAFIELTNVVKLDEVMAELGKMFGSGKEQFIPVNERALRRGMEAAAAVSGASH